jgi:hypothetical protein
MAKHKHEVHLETQPTDTPVELEESPYPELDEVSMGMHLPVTTPLQQILNALEPVANGGSVGDLRTLVASVMPKDKTEAEAFLKVLKRLQDATAVVYVSAYEQYSSISTVR